MNRHNLQLLAVLILIAGTSRVTGAEAGILDPDLLLAKQTWWDNRDWDWYKQNIPFVETPDPEIDATYYYRWEVVTKHMVYGSPDTGYVFTEFIDRPGWSGAYGSISCPLGHQFYELRWLKDRRPVQDYAHYWFETKGAAPRSYSNWYGDAMWAVYEVSGEKEFILAVLPHMIAQYKGWESSHFDPAHGMFKQHGMADGMETSITSRVTSNAFAGAIGYRPTLNSYLFADAVAISKASQLKGDTEIAKIYADKAAALKARVQKELWDPSRNFFFHQYANDEINGIKAKSLTYQTGKFAGNEHGREEIGYVPWQFNLPDEGFESAWKYIMDPNYFFAQYGPTVTERHDPQFFIAPNCCAWSGNAWPYATTQTLVAMANLLNNYHQKVVTSADYFKLLKAYTAGQRKNGRPYIAEAVHPDTGSWSGHDNFNHSEHYFHSGYVDLIVTGMAGLRPRADDILEVNPLVPAEWNYFALDRCLYHGHLVSILWDRDGTRYHKGAGLSLIVDGKTVMNSKEIQKLQVQITPAREYGPLDRPVNFAVNNDGTYFPRVHASYSFPATPVNAVNDGNYWYHLSPPNRWTTLNSPNKQDWVEVDFGVERPVESVKLYLLDDENQIAAPKSYELQAWIGMQWKEIPGQDRSPAEPTGHRANVIRFPEIKTAKIRVVLTHRDNSFSGLTEIEAWGHEKLPLPQPTAPIKDLAFNPTGKGYPKASASFTSQFDRIEEINDGKSFLTVNSRNRWTAYQSPNKTDWVEIDFGALKKVSMVELLLWGDGGGVRAPKRYQIQYLDNEKWVDVVETERNPEKPKAMAINTVKFKQVESSKIRVNFEHDLPGFAGVTEIMIWE